MRLLDVVVFVTRSSDVETIVLPSFNVYATPPGLFAHVSAVPDAGVLLVTLMPNV